LLCYIKNFKINLWGFGHYDSIKISSEGEICFTKLVGLNYYTDRKSIYNNHDIIDPLYKNKILIIASDLEYIDLDIYLTDAIKYINLKGNKIKQFF